MTKIELVSGTTYDVIEDNLHEIERDTNGHTPITTTDGRSIAIDLTKVVLEETIN